MPATKIKFQGILKLQPEKTDRDGTYYGEYFYEIEHYFNENMEEVEMVTFPGTRFEAHTIFEPARKWDHSIFNKYAIRKIR